MQLPGHWERQQPPSHTKAAVVSCIVALARAAERLHLQGIGRFGHYWLVAAAVGGTLATKARVAATAVGRQLVGAARVQLGVAEMATFVNLKACQKLARWVIVSTKHK